MCIRVLAAFWLLSIVWLGTAFAATPPEGTLITNIFQGQFVTPLGETLQRESNETVAQVHTPVQAVAINKQVSTSQAIANDILRYTITMENTGTAPVEPVNVTIDGMSAQRVILRDIIPSNTRFTAFEGTASGTYLYQLHGDAADSWRSGTPSDTTQVSAVALAMAGFPAGATAALAFTAQIFDYAYGSIYNTADIFVDGSVVESNQTVTTLPDLPPQIHYYLPDFSSYTDRSRLGAPVYLQVLAPSCNLDPLQSDQREVTISSLLTGDEETFLAFEIAPNSSLFRVYAADGMAALPTRDGFLNGGAVPGNGIIETAVNDTLIATLKPPGSAAVSPGSAAVPPGCTAAAETQILIDPAGVVFSTCDNQPVAGTRVRLFNADTGLPADVFDHDSVTPAPNDVVTGANGFYEFPRVAPGNYQLRIDVPGNHQFPSVVPLVNMPADRDVHAEASFGQVFAVNAVTGMVIADVPLDCDRPGQLHIDKKTSRSSVAVGELNSYSITLRSTNVNTLDNVVVTDSLPLGFRYMEGSARLDDVAVADPSGSPGPKLRFNVGSIAAGAQAVLTYRVRVEMGALRGNGINRARAEGMDALTTATVRSNQAEAEVEVLPDVFSSEAFVVGKFYMDCDRNRVQGREELGVPGVRLFLDDGTFVVTDSEGKFSLYGLRARTHVLKVDRSTLPAGAELITLDNRHGGDPYSRFVDLRAGELHRADFALGSCHDEVRAEVHMRRTSGEVAQEEKSFERELPLDASRPLRDNFRDTRASGMVENGQPNGARALDIVPLGTTDPDSAVAPLPAERVAPLALPRPFEELLHELDNRIDFLDLQDGQVLPAKSIVRLKGPLQARLELRLNGEVIGAGNRGEYAALESRAIQAHEYVSLPLRAGDNQFELLAYDGFGNVRGRSERSVKVPGAPARIVIDAPARAVADGVSTRIITLRVVDQNGLPVATRLPITLHASVGEWRTRDLDDNATGLQQFIEGGELEVIYLSPSAPGDVVISATSDRLAADHTMQFIPHLRDMVAVGLIEGVISMKDLSRGAITPANRNDGFEDELRHNMLNDDEVTLGVRTSLYLKGKVKGEYLLTVAYDSDKDTRQRMFRDIRPDEFYPVYGDSSQRGFDAQSTSTLYVRVDHERSWVLYGDFTSGGESPARKLGDYRRSLTGIQARHETGPWKLDGFATHDTTTQVVDEMRADGTSGPYRLSRFDVVPNSERVEIIVRDRDQSGRIISSKVQARFTDYELDYFSGGILFRQPVASLDSNLNPVYIRVTYEQEQGGTAFWIRGAGAQYRVNDLLELGGQTVRDENPIQNYLLDSANATLHLGPNTTLVTELAKSEGVAGEGNAGRVEFQHRDDKSELQAHYLQAERTFENASAGVVPGRSEAGARGMYRVAEDTRLHGEWLRTDSTVDGYTRDGVHAQVEQMLGGNVSGRLGVRHTQHDGGPLVPGGAVPLAEQTSLTSRLGWQPVTMSEMTLYGEYEQDFDAHDRQLIALGGDYQLAARSRMYVRHELASSINGGYGLNDKTTQYTTLVGIDAGYGNKGQVFSEYRSRDAFGGRDTQAAIGLRNGWEIDDGVNVNAGFERVEALDGSRDMESTAVTGGVAWTASQLWKASARAEWRTSLPEDSLLNTLGLAAKINRNWTFLGRNHLFQQERVSTGHALRDRLQLGVAYRETDTNLWNVLGRYEFRHEDDSTLIGLRNVHILSSHGNRALGNSMYLSGRLATKWVDEEMIDGFENQYRGHLVEARWLWDVYSNWDLSLFGSRLFDDRSSMVQDGIGLEVGHLMAANLWLSLGYNFQGYHDPDLTSRYTLQGIYMRLRFKFDETLFEADPLKASTNGG